MGRFRSKGQIEVHGSKDWVREDQNGDSQRHRRKAVSFGASSEGTQAKNSSRTATSYQCGPRIARRGTDFSLGCRDGTSRDETGRFKGNKSCEKSAEDGQMNETSKIFSAPRGSLEVALLARSFLQPFSFLRFCIWAPHVEVLVQSLYHFSTRFEWNCIGSCCWSWARSEWEVYKMTGMIVGWLWVDSCFWLWNNYMAVLVFGILLALPALFATAALEPFWNRRYSWRIEVNLCGRRKSVRRHSFYPGVKMTKPIIGYLLVAAFGGWGWIHVLSWRSWG